jgi:VPDSG-CTERM motif
MKNIIKIAVVAAIAFAASQSVQATSISGTVGFSGSAQLDGSSVVNSTEVLSWANNNVTIANGNFSGLINSPVTLAAPWYFTAAQAGFWSVGGFTFNLTSSTVTAPVLNPVTGYYSLTIFLAGTVTAKGYDNTSFTGSISIQDPAANNDGLFNYSESMSFSSVPDGGTTALLLGSALSGLALIRRKLNI